MNLFYLIFFLFFFSDLSCNYKAGNGIGKREYRVGKIDSPRECSIRCIRMKKRRADVNGVIYASRFRVCYCVGGMTGRRKNAIWRSCFLEEKTKTTPKLLLETRLAKGEIPIFEQKRSVPQMLIILIFFV